MSTFELDGRETRQLISRVAKVSKINLTPPVKVITDTTNFMKINRGQVIRLEGRSFVVSGDVYEPRFGLEEQPKFWVKRGYDLDNGGMVIIKLEFHEEFVTQVGPFRIPCFRSPKKESEVIRLVRGDSRFMQGETFFDSAGNNVRVLKFIQGKTLFHHILDMETDHEQYYYTRLAPILRKLIACCEAIRMLNDHDLCHGDIRNDHILIEEGTGEFRWIDFDLYQNFAAFDVWSLGRVIHFVTGKSLATFHDICTGGSFPAEVISSLQPADANMFFPNRLMNLRKIYPYINERLNNILMRFSVGAKRNYATVSELVQDLQEVVADI
jgi:hypothetical protein